MTGIVDGIKKALEPQPENKCPECNNNSLIPWVIRVHEGNQLTENPTRYPIGLRCEKCEFTVVHKPMPVFACFERYYVENQLNEQVYDMLLKAIERCVIDHRKDCIPQYAWDIVAPRVKKNLAYYRAQECTNSPLNTPEYWESDHWTLICYEAYGRCIWGFD